MLKSVSTSLVPLYCAPPQKPLSNSLSLCVILRENCHFLFQSTYFESGVWSTCRLLFCPVSPSRGQVRSQELFSGGKQNLKNFTPRHVLAGCGPYMRLVRIMAFTVHTVSLQVFGLVKFRPSRTKTHFGWHFLYTGPPSL